MQPLPPEAPVRAARGRARPLNRGIDLGGAPPYTRAMKPLALAMLATLFLSAAGTGAQPRGSEERRFSYLRPGLYDIGLEGLVCTACAEAIRQAVSAVNGIDGAEVDFEKAVLRVSVAKGRGVKMSALERALAQASQRVRLGTSFRLGSVRYVP